MNTLKQSYENGYVTGASNTDVYFVSDCECVSNAKVFGLRDSIRRAKFPMAVDTTQLNYELTDGIKSLALSNRGEGHDQWLTGVIVQFDLTFSNKAWVEAERYHFFDFVSSQSTIHRITSFNPDTAYNKYVDRRIVSVMKELVKKYNVVSSQMQSNQFLKNSYKKLEMMRKRLYLKILYSNPSGFLLTAGMTTNYRQLKTIYAQRKNHKLPEWRKFCTWIEKLPMSELITGEEKQC